MANRSGSPYAHPFRRIPADFNEISLISVVLILLDSFYDTYLIR
ncbi:hypothetical protein HMPREF9163_01625 [Selenomonas sp. oral taxon 138 str. F0429]|nr:hypothetical protein HMPREF9163_01625 [Selenomonas sp. oral taxon 138 str. F0429]